jgi:hypothetical protein
MTLMIAQNSKNSNEEGDVKIIVQQIQKSVSQWVVRGREWWLTNRYDEYHSFTNGLNTKV